MYTKVSVSNRTETQLGIDTENVEKTELVGSPDARLVQLMNEN